ncbi:MAG: Primary replicative DNA helicase [Candidatus Giovannonibacteria bacterium GW2011_GWA2_44_13b]|uniref:Replicative DNA helicase n=2 Tax=Candidatus Giovannoniibacteriota TaxID=1752738 RepID=A0A0G1JEA2_9BACT|nr:MAG: Primary replicative DNA helicase [Candidatus Giovannonibacteria bacterium GW2011_GWA2_44_13b]OGF82774.1 MAG: replicative DNA helicase [Candidatus Giovannonibacteria bacterium RIFCSPLOWO2_01_FULL_44_16]
MAQVLSPFSVSRMPPQQVEAEISLLGSILLDGATMDKIVDILNGEDFYKPEHRMVFDAMALLFEKQKPIDILSVSNSLKESKRLEDIGGQSYLANLVNSVPTASNAAYYAEIIKKKKILRDLISVSHDISQLGYQEDGDIDTLLDSAEQRVFQIAHKSLIKGFMPVSAALEEAWERIDKLHNNAGDGSLRGVPTGFKGLDNILSGLQNSDLIILAARPSLGKTTLAMDIARHAAMREKIPTGIFSLEMSVDQITDRLISAEANVDLWKLRTGRLSSQSEDFQRIRDSLDSLKNAPLYIDDEASINIMQMRAKARRLKAEKGLGLIVVDYLQLMVPRTQSDSMVQQITEISRSLKGLARELNIPILALSQLNRQIENRPNKKPQLSDLRDSGAIEQDADVVMFIHREDKVKENSDRPNQADILIEKHRNGPLGKVTLYFNQEKVSFSAIERNFE